MESILSEIKKHSKNLIEGFQKDKNELALFPSIFSRFFHHTEIVTVFFISKCSPQKSQLSSNEVSLIHVFAGFCGRGRRPCPSLLGPGDRRLELLESAARGNLLAALSGG